MHAALKLLIALALALYFLQYQRVQQSRCDDCYPLKYLNGVYDI